MKDIPATAILALYAEGAFPMAESRDDPALRVVEPQFRGLLPLDGFHVSRSLGRRLRSGCFSATADRAFMEVVHACADREETWINDTLLGVYAGLHEAGHAHSIEVWQDGLLAGGVYGVSLAGAFFAESMFSRRTDASKAALVWLVRRLKAQGYLFCDTQFLTPHLASLGGYEMPRQAFRRLLAEALQHREVVFGPPGPLPASATLPR